MNAVTSIPPHIGIATKAETHLVIVEQQPVITLPDFQSAFVAFIGVIYAMNLMYPGKRTYEFIQHALLDIGAKKLSAKVLSVTEKLATVNRLHTVCLKNRHFWNCYTY